MLPKPNKVIIQRFNESAHAQWPELLPPPERRELLVRKAARLLNSTCYLRFLQKLPSQRLAVKRPYPALPSFVKYEARKDVLLILSDYFSGTSEQARVRGFLDDRVVGFRFGTDWIDGRWRMVVPQLKNRLCDLMGLAHELGHLLAGESAVPSFKEQVRGEAMALVLEDLVVSHELARMGFTADLKEWRAYVESSDQFNFEFCRREFSSDPEELMPSGFIFRESLWTSDGYQAVYAAASLIRQKVLKGFFA